MLCLLQTLALPSRHQASLLVILRSTDCPETRIFGFSMHIWIGRSSLSVPNLVFSRSTTIATQGSNILTKSEKVDWLKARHMIQQYHENEGFHGEWLHPSYIIHTGQKKRTLSPIARETPNIICTMRQLVLLLNVNYFLVICHGLALDATELLVAHNTYRCM